MQYLKWIDGNEYDGSQINPSWAFQEFKVKDSTIVSWVGPMNILGDNLIDYEDVGLDIKGNLMLNFIVEHFDEQPGNLKLAYHRQRILVMITRDKLLDYGIKTTQDGDDIFINGKKASVSIAAKTLTSVLIHFAINIISEGAIIEVSSLGDDTTISNYEEFAKKLMISYINEIEDIKLATTKVWGVYNEQ